MSCEDCGSTKWISKIVRFNLCKDCKTKEKYKLITTSTAKLDFFLTNKDLEKIDYEEKPNPHFKKASPMKLYLESDIKKYFLKKHKIKTKDFEFKILELENIKLERSLKLNNNKIIKRDNREKELQEALESRGLGLRDDSNLCHGFINGSIKNWSVKEIVERMCQMKYIHEYCDFDKYYEKAKKFKREEREYGGFSPESTFDLAEVMLLETIGKYPDKYPWEN